MTRPSEPGQVSGVRRLLPVYRTEADGVVLIGHVTWSLLDADELHALADAIADDLRPDAGGRLVLP